MVDFFPGIFVVGYFLAAALMMIYGFNCYVMIFLFKQGRRMAEERRRNVLTEFGDLHDRDDLPNVTTQIPVYNEFNVVERIMWAACSMDYPQGKHEIQILDDSDDETRTLIDAVAAKLADLGYDIKAIRRNSRRGFKAGALAEGTKRAKGELIAIFDADFVPPEDYLLKTVPFFLADEKTGLVQARWGHLNYRKSLLTRAQSIGIDGHFLVEQSARNWGGLYMNFNGTAGMWRKQAIEDGGGWQWDTLTEDMDLSYRVQFAGWETVYLPDVVVPAEIPENVCAFKIQQFRWAKGSIQTALKLLPGLFASEVPLFKKVEAFFHLTHYVVHPLMAFLAVSTLPILSLIDRGLGPVMFAFIASILVLTMTAPSLLYLVSQRSGYSDWLSRIVYLPFLVIIGTGIALSNSRAVFEAVIGRRSGFVRTPKKGHREIKSYRVKLPGSAFAEIALGLYCLFSFWRFLTVGQSLIGPFLAVYASGFLFVGFLTLLHTIGSKK